MSQKNHDSFVNLKTVSPSLLYGDSDVGDEKVSGVDQLMVQLMIHFKKSAEII